MAARGYGLKAMKITMAFVKALIEIPAEGILVLLILGALCYGTFQV